MTSMTIRNLDDDVVRRLRVRAAEHSRSMEEEARDILRQVVGLPVAPCNLGQAIHARFAALGVVDLPATQRGPMRLTQDFE
ncbi:MAG: FitA-like ribbon-helix-helix domain-containing protein [Gemmobacter sp.]